MYVQLYVYVRTAVCTTYVHSKHRLGNEFAMSRTFQAFLNSLHSAVQGPSLFKSLEGAYEMKCSKMVAKRTINTAFASQLAKATSAISMQRAQTRTKACALQLYP